ncbi:MAG: NAD(P)/FAD-dependent oxidoreductase [Eubacteriales bacterium]|nr:NAD(P)/FAD-dependent oxidoreductase [Eubacteriales bacterium]
MTKKYDIIIIGAGVTGCAIARELSRRERSVAVLERASDVCEGTSKANSGIAHAGYDAEPGSRKAQMNIRGSRMLEGLSKELDFPYRRNGSIVLGFAPEDRERLQKLYDKGIANGVEGLRILSGEEARSLEPNLNETVTAALYAPTGGIVDPFLMTVALAENANVNGVEFFFRTEVQSIERLAPSGEAADSAEAAQHALSGADSGEADYRYRLTTSGGTFEARSVVNAAGVYADTIHNMVSARKIHITPRKGEYLLLDKKTGGFVNATVFQCPTVMGKGILVTPTVHGNLLIGPTSEDIGDKEGVNTTAAGLEEVIAKAGLSAGAVPARQVITSFAGLRAHEDGDDFLIGEAEDAPGFYDAAGIESPGLTSAPAIGEYVAALIQERTPAPEKKNFQAKRQGIPCMQLSDPAAKKRLIEQNPLYGNVVCRCELVTEGEIVDAIRRPVGATTLDGIKRRVRAGMGRCQAGFCTPKQMEILARELGVDIGEITKNDPGSELLEGTTKQSEVQ